MFSLQHQNTMNVTPRLFECENLYQQQRLMASTSSFGNQFRGNQPNSNDSSYANIFSRFAFPFKLHAMLEDTCAEGMEDVVSWQPGGKSFRVHKPKEFAANVMPRYFKKIKYRSWQRQLHIYGFRLIKNKKSIDHGAYFHPQFIRGQKDLCLQMTRERMNKGGNSSGGLLKDKLRSKLACFSHQKEETTNVVSPSHSIEETPALSPEPLVLTNQPSAVEWVSFAQHLLKENQKDTYRDGDEMFFEGMRFYYVDETEDKLQSSQNTSLHVPTIPQPQRRGMQRHVLANPAA